MNLKKLNERDLIELINTTNDPDLLDRAEAEYLSRMDRTMTDFLLEEFDDLENEEDRIINEVMKTWRPG